MEATIEVRILYIEIETCVWLKCELKTNYDIWYGKNLKRVKNIYIYIYNIDLISLL